MVRKQVYIEERQEALLKELSHQLGVPEAVLIRRGIDRCLEGGGLGSSPDLKVWEEELAFIQSSPMRLGGARWRREDLYDR